MPKTVLRTVVVMKRIPQPFGRKVWGYRSSDEKNQKKRLAFFGFFRGWGQAQERRQEKGTGRSREAHSRVVRYLQAAL